MFRILILILLAASACTVSRETVIPPAAPPVVNTPILTQLAIHPPPANGLVVNPYITFDSATYVIQSETTVILVWPDAPTNAVQAEFILFEDGATTGIPLGIDQNMEDGISVQAFFRQGMRGQLFAVAYFPGQMHDFIESAKLYLIAQ